MKLREAQKSCPEVLKSLENLKIRNLDFHKDVGNWLKVIDFQAPKATCELRFASERL